MVVIDEIFSEVTIENAKKEEKESIKTENVNVELKEEQKETTQQEANLKEETKKPIAEVKTNEGLSKFSGPR